MKKLSAALIVLICLALSASAMTACSKLGTKDTKEPSGVSTQDSPTQNDHADIRNKMLHGKDSKEKIQAFIDSDALKQKSAAMKKDAQSKGFDFEMSVGEDDNNSPLLIFTYTFNGSLKNETKDKMEKSLEDKRDSMDALAKSMQDNMGIPGARVRVIVRDSNKNNAPISNDYSGGDNNSKGPLIPEKPETETTVTSENADVQNEDENPDGEEPDADVQQDAE